MFKLLKWDFRNFIHKYGWLYISCIATLLVTVGFPNHLCPYSSIIDGLAAVYSLFFFGYTFLASLSVPISWLRCSSSLLELSLPVKPWKILLGKIILALAVNLSGFFLTKLLWMALSGFGMSHIVLFKGLSSWLQFITGMATLMIIWMFSYISAKSFSFTRSRAQASTTLVAAVICVFLVCFMAALFIFCTKSIATMIFPLVVIVSGFFGSCKLLEHRFERY